MESKVAVAATLSQLLMGRVRGALDVSHPIALVEFPDHGNFGDSAIWLGALEVLGALGCEVAYVASPETYDRIGVRRAIGSKGTVVFNGGGSFGDVWRNSESFKLRVLGDNSDRKVLFLPQSICFTTPEARKKWVSVLAEVRQLTVMVRDSTSLNRASRLGVREPILAPDAAFALRIGPENRGVPSVPVLWQWRNDRESSRLIGPDALECAPSDWPRDPFYARPWARGGFRREIRRARLLSLRAGGRAFGSRASPMAEFQARAQLRTEVAVRYLSQGQMVVTDRLHGHILCVLLGIPNLPLDNAHGKLSSFVGTWKTHSRIADLKASDASLSALVARNVARLGEVVE